MNNRYIFSLVIFCIGTHIHYMKARNVDGAYVMEMYPKKYEFPFELLNEDYDHDKIVVYKTLEDQKHSYITFLKDLDGNCYVVKQDKSFSLKAQFQVVLEVVSAYMAEQLHISAHQVELLPVGTIFPGKIVIERPATIHTLVTGLVIKDIAYKLFAKFSINQGGNQKYSARGLTEFVIKCMSRHADLSPIVALDTFIANRDRSRKNLIYDEYKNKFYAIDMALVYDPPLEDLFIPYLSCKNIEVMIKRGTSFKKRKKKALHSYYHTLLQLLEKFPPEATYSLVYEFAEKSGLVEKYNNNIAFENLLLKYKTVIEKAYSENKRLVILLEKLLSDSL